MNAKQQIFRIRRNYNQWVNNQTLEDYALRFTAKRSRKWSLAQVAMTALGAISFLALEAIGGTITLNYGFGNAVFAITVVSVTIFLMGIPICYYAAKYGVDIDLLTRGAGFGYIGSTFTSLIYASFTFIFFALEAAIMAMALELLFQIPPAIGYFICSIVVIPLVAYGITFISRFQLWTQPIWVFLQLLPFVFILLYDFATVSSWPSYGGTFDVRSIELAYFGAATSVLFSLIAQIGEQVDYLRFLPEKTRANKLGWWIALIAGGPGWIIIGALKLLAGSLLAYIAIQNGITEDRAADPSRMYLVAFGYVTESPHVALALGGIFVIISQLKINVTNSYAGSIAWSNFFSRLTHSHPGRVVWLVFNVVIALMLMELGIYQAFEDTLGIYAIVAVAWVSALVADLVINKPLGISPPYIEFKRAHLYDINPVGVGAMTLSCLVGIICYLGIPGQTMQALAHFMALLVAFIAVPVIGLLTGGKFYIAREPETLSFDQETPECCICQNHYEKEDMALCPAYAGPICSLCCSLDARCQDSCKSEKRLGEQLQDWFSRIMPPHIVDYVNTRVIQFFCLLIFIAVITGILLVLVYDNGQIHNNYFNSVLQTVLWKVFFILIIIAGVISWLFVLAHESREVAQEESHRQNRLLMEEIEAHEKTDIALQKAKEVAEAANNAKSRYLTGISHELRTPLNSILGYAQLLENETTLPPKSREQVSVIRRSGEHLTDLIEGLLDISKIEAGRLDIHRDQVRISPLLDQLVNMFRLQAEEKGLAFNYQCLSTLPEFVATDEKRLRQILINLLSNAVKFTEIGSITFSISYRNQVAEFKVVDSGVGIPEEDMERIYKPFERLRGPGVPYVHGTGLGLTITRLLTDIMGGEIEVANNPQGGVTFTVWLMLSRITAPNVDTQTSQCIYGYAGGRKTILVVDDDPAHRGLISDILSPLGFTVLEAPDAMTSFSILDECEPDLCLMDISMPDVDGWSAAKIFRDRQYKRPIIMISADADEGNYHQKARPIHNDYIIKPVKIDNLLDKVGHCLHLSWQFEPKISAYNSGIGKSLFTENEKPDHTHIDSLIALAEIGHLSGLKERIYELEKQKLAGVNFIKQLRTLTNNVKFDSIIRLLRPQQHETDQ